MSTAEAPQPLPGARMLFTLDPAVAHLDHGGVGATPLAVQRAQQRVRDEMEANPAAFFGRGLLERLAHTRDYLGRFVSAPVDSCMFVANARAALAIVLGSMDLRDRDEIVTTDHGSPGIAAAVDAACRAVGARHRVAVVKLACDDAAVVEAVVAVLSHRTRLVIIDHVTGLTARVFPVRDVVRAARGIGAAIFVDASHVPGVFQADIESVLADFWVGEWHTWAFAPRPSALLAVLPPWRERLRPPLGETPDDLWSPHGAACQGIADHSSWLATPAGLHVLRELGPERVLAHNAALAAYGQDVVAAALGVEPPRLPGGGNGALVPMRIVPMPQRAAATAQAAAALRVRIAEELSAEVAVGFWRGRAVLRLSAQVYNTAQQYEQLADGLRRLLAGA